MFVGAWGVKNSTWKENGWKDEIKRDLRSTVFCVAVIMGTKIMGVKNAKSWSEVWPAALR